MITKDEVKRIAKLSMLNIDDSELDTFVDQFNDILNYMEQINELDLSSCDAVYHIVELKNVFREDVVKPSISNEKALKNAPDAAYGAFRVPKVIER
ncbi:Asp-tRNA(Asn)/Glu-tRNA(Gln) amidotransferase subunit GatC [Hippea jasoniae]|uniref:Asp-tRNA(Asn)/Glu-tRNA(Gln) amidotransferase subunit GatC n=1 Tax=Hippea jasoniae TaxID=944479 RepID=UPI00055127BF|nr:Asp-tRNA(Asn)/Glu-tRNA(Gln) amidotransferase subunit GatC [Hippea jasoniae]